MKVPVRFLAADVLTNNPQRRARLEDLKRAALFTAVRVAHDLDGPDEWRLRSAACEQEADSHVQRLLLAHPARTWQWTLRVQIVLEDEEPVAADLVLPAGPSWRGLRANLADHFAALADDTSNLLEYRLEAHRIQQLLSGHASPKPQRSPWSVVLDNLERRRTGRHDPTDGPTLAPVASRPRRAGRPAGNG